MISYEINNNSSLKLNSNSLQLNGRVFQITVTSVDTFTISPNVTDDGNF